MKKFFKEFKEFVSRGNVLDMAVGVIIGAAFKDIVNSLVNDIITPVISLVFKADFSDLAVTFKEAVLDGEGTVLEEAITFNYGAFITAVINFIILAFVVFLIIKGINAIMSMGKKKKVEEQAPPTTKVCPYCLSEIPVNATRCAHCTSQLD